MFDRKQLLNEENLPFPINSVHQFVESVCYFANSIYPRFLLDSTLEFNNEKNSIRAFSEDCDFELGLGIKKEHWPDLTLTIRHLYLHGSNRETFIDLVLSFAAIAKEFNYQNLGVSHVPDWLAASIRSPGFKSIDERTHILELVSPSPPFDRWDTILQ